jgi:broad specificity phosphatase PhoE
MPIAVDGNHYESEMHYQLDLPTVMDDGENRDKYLSQGGQKREPLRVTITPHMFEGESEEGSPYRQLDEPKTMHFIRHGATPENADNTIREKDAELTDEGRGQAAEAGRQLKEKGVNAIVSSTLPRAMETAHIIASKLGIIPQFDSRLNTWGMGTLEGQPCSPENLQTIKDHVEKTPDKALGGEESFNDFKDRSFAGIRDAILNNKDKELGIVTHSKTEGALKSWEATGQDNPSIDPEVVNATPDKPGTIEKFTMQPDSTIMQPATYSKQQFAGGPGPTPQSDTPLARYMQYAGENTMQSLKDMTDPYQFVPSPGILEAGPLLGIFGGRNALTANFGKLMQAQHMHYNTPIEPYEIFRKTGWYKDPHDEHWKHFIPNQSVDLINEGFNIVKPKRTIAYVKPGWESVLPSDEPIYHIRAGSKLGDIYQNPNLFAAYPELKDLPVVVEQRKDFHGGMQKNKATGEPIAMHLAPNTKEMMLTAIQHELQHAVQGLEGFPSGATTGGKTNLSYKDYFRTSGEVEARNAAYWLNNPEDVKGFTPPETYDKMLDVEHMTSKDIVVRNNKNVPEPSEPVAIPDFLSKGPAGNPKKDWTGLVPFGKNTIESSRPIGIPNTSLLKPMPEAERKVLQDFLDKGLTYGQIAEKLGKTRSAVAGRINKMRGYVRNDRTRLAAEPAKTEPYSPTIKGSKGDPEFEKAISKWLEENQK